MHGAATTDGDRRQSQIGDEATLLLQIYSQEDGLVQRLLHKDIPLNVAHNGESLNSLANAMLEGISYVKNNSIK